MHTGFTMNGGSRLHHIGFVVASIAQEIERFADSIGAHWNETILHDPLQKARVAFLRTSGPTDALVELIEPAGQGSPVQHFLQKGGGLHHLCYEVEHLEDHLRAMRLKGAVVVRGPRPAVAFDNRRIAWTFTREKLLLEFLERKAL